VTVTPSYFQLCPIDSENVRGRELCLWHLPSRYQNLHYPPTPFSQHGHNLLPVSLSVFLLSGPSAAFLCFISSGFRFSLLPLSLFSLCLSFPSNIFTPTLFSFLFHWLSLEQVIYSSFLVFVRFLYKLLTSPLLSSIIVKSNSPCSPS